MTAFGTPQRQAGSDVFLAPLCVRCKRVAPAAVYFDRERRQPSRARWVGCADRGDYHAVPCQELGAHETPDGQHGVVEMR
jgi:hypothetical protein